MFNNATGFHKVILACGFTDLRLGIDGLSTIVKEHFKMDPFQPNNLFLFCGRRTDRIKGLVWEEDGYLLLYKRLEAGQFKWPRNADEVMTITPEQYVWLMQGLAIEQKRTIQKITPKAPL